MTRAWNIMLELARQELAELEVDLQMYKDKAEDSHCDRPLWLQAMEEAMADQDSIRAWMRAYESAGGLEP